MSGKLLLDEWMGKVRQGDCVEFMRDLPSESVDMVFADPPFNIGKDYGEHSSDNRADYWQWCDGWISECFRLLKPTGSFYLMHLTRCLPKLFPLMENQGVYVNQISWKNTSACPSKRQFWPASQPILLYGKTEDYIFNTYAETKFSEKNMRWGGYSTAAKGQLLDYWDDIPFVFTGCSKHPEAICKTGSNSKEHPCQMPTGLVKRAMLFSTNDDAVILDPFMGSGTTAVACEQLGRRWLGCEINPQYVALAEKRITAERAKVKLEL